jgi:hypothetical protein
MVILWRRFVVWLRSLLLAIYARKSIDWPNKLNALVLILLDVFKKQEEKVEETVTPENKQPIRNFLRRILKKK